MQRLLLSTFKFLPVSFRRLFWLLLRRIGVHFYGRIGLGSTQRLPFGFYAKEHSSYLTEREVVVMQYVSASTTIPIPTVVDVFDNTIPGDDHGTCVFIMTRMPGVWPALSDWSQSQRKQLAREIRSCLDQLRALSPPSSAVCGFSGGPCLESRLAWRASGPFADLATFHNFLRSDVPPRIAANHTVTSIHNRSYRIVLTHDDINPYNILVTPDCHLAAIIDWERAGWYPEYWEHAMSMFCLSEWPAWAELMKDTFPEYESERHAEELLWRHSRHL